MKFPAFVVCVLCSSVTLARENTYKAAIIGASTFGSYDSYLPLIQEAGKSNVDIVVLPSPQDLSSSVNLEKACEINNNDDVVKLLSKASKQAGLYVVAHVLEKTRCQNRNELIRSNVVFDREGSVVSVYSKPVNQVANCTIPKAEITTFITDFGVQFGLLMAEDLFLQKFEETKDLRNFVIAGVGSEERNILRGSQFAASWAFVNNKNLVTSSGVFAGKGGVSLPSENGLLVAQLSQTGESQSPIVPPVVYSSKMKLLSEEDLSQYTIKPLDVVASVQGLEDTVCHGEFCCEFFIKFRNDAHNSGEVNYGLGAFDGIRQFGRHNIGLQSCLMFNRSNKTNVLFEKISVSSKFVAHTTQYPIIMADSKLQEDRFNFETRTDNEVTAVSMDLSDANNVFICGIYSRDYSMDSDVVTSDDTMDMKDEMEDLFDYLWIRLRVLFFVVSIYFLEMM